MSAKALSQTKREDRKGGQEQVREMYVIRSLRYRLHFVPFRPNELWVSELMNGSPVNNGRAVISLLAHSSRVILGNFWLGLNQ